MTLASIELLSVTFSPVTGPTSTVRVATSP